MTSEGLPQTSRRRPLDPRTKLKDPSLFIEKAYINGEWVGNASRHTFNVNNPATDEVLGVCPELSKAETEAAIAAASTAFESFRATSARERSRLLRKWYELVTANKDDLAVLITLENGKALVDANAEVAYAASFLEWFSEEAPRSYGDLIPATVAGNQVFTIREPVGVCGLITPLPFSLAELSIRSWNFPAAMITRKAGAALAAGCTVVIKSPGETPFTVNALAELANRAGIPKGVINVVTALSNTVEVGHTLTSSPLVHKISFTGSTRVGKLLMRQCAETTLKKVSLELGGNAPFIVFPDADIDAAIDGLIISKFRGSGQTCVCANRIFVHQSVYDEFAAKLAAYVRNHFKAGDSLSTGGITHGPLIHQAAVHKVESHVKDAVSKGAIVLTGGSRLPALGPNFFAPTVLSNMHDSMQLASEETFGPVAGLFSFQTETEVIRRANQTEVGLAGYLFSRDVQRVWRVARALEIGMVGINTGVISDAAAPFGGVKSSGFGREGSKYGMDEYLTTKMIALGGNTIASRKARL
ncbi:succinate semialdehyde dehydrogenase NADP+ linked [Exophiala xenobiotica]|nr:succinate semialdehyde dehydrogenase NADP+ linked [Exophiala xenobiotica]KAK5288379.1 succinate semialdehyde dehydrogenase NADP+ linked [Exophiala xenobiotica]KAK5307104.1 succinate semialdehyde dehydrogenase NADP+ linked [Exophiala xenobiotica]KAK5439108.1 succinate semialdehyde dehydrogenase NADP+ linked [Exophiala xenobiotica]KAK5476655.1 succinate semialdehyde dehydrogenase NADP+ linked [Exophiala xenobiotica]